MSGTARKMPSPETDPTSIESFPPGVPIPGYEHRSDLTSRTSYLARCDWSPICVRAVSPRDLQGGKDCGRCANERAGYEAAKAAGRLLGAPRFADVRALVLSIAPAHRQPQGRDQSWRDLADLPRGSAVIVFARCPDGCTTIRSLPLKSVGKRCRACGHRRRVEAREVPDPLSDLRNQFRGLLTGSSSNPLRFNGDGSWEGGRVYLVAASQVSASKNGPTDAECAEDQPSTGNAYGMFECLWPGCHQVFRRTISAWMAAHPERALSDESYVPTVRTRLCQTHRCMAFRARERQLTGLAAAQFIRLASDPDGMSRDPVTVPSQPKLHGKTVPGLFWCLGCDQAMRHNIESLKKGEAERALTCETCAWKSRRQELLLNYPDLVDEYVGCPNQSDVTKRMRAHKEPVDKLAYESEPLERFALGSDRTVLLWRCRKCSHMFVASLGVRRQGYDGTYRGAPSNRGACPRAHRLQRRLVADEFAAFFNSVIALYERLDGMYGVPDLSRERPKTPTLSVWAALVAEVPCATPECRKTLYVEVGSATDGAHLRCVGCHPQLKWSKAEVHLGCELAAYLYPWATVRLAGRDANGRTWDIELEFADSWRVLIDYDSAYHHSDAQSIAVDTNKTTDARRAESSTMLLRVRPDELPPIPGSILARTPDLGKTVPETVNVLARLAEQARRDERTYASALDALVEDAKASARRLSAGMRSWLFSNRRLMPVLTRPVDLTVAWEEFDLSRGSRTDAKVTSR